MSVLRNLESKLAGLVEGTFSRAFKSEVRPVEIARKLAREMDQHRVQSLSRTYAPNEYAVWLPPDARRQFEGYEDELKRGLAGYLLEHARRERISLVTRPSIEFRTDERLRLGEFGIQARLVRPPQDAAEAPRQGDHGRTMVYPVAVALKFGFLAVLYLFLLWMARSALKDLRRGGADEVAPAYEDATGLHHATAGLTGDVDGGVPKLRVNSAAGLRAGSAYDLSEGALLGRGEAADIRLEDTFASSSHARLVPQGDVIVLEDLGSTNGTYLNGEPLRGPQPLHVGDSIRIGDSEFTFER